MKSRERFLRNLSLIREKHLLGDQNPGHYRYRITWAGSGKRTYCSSAGLKEIASKIEADPDYISDQEYYEEEV